MNENGTKMQNRFFQFNWGAFNWIAGIKFAILAFVAVALTVFTDLDMVVVLIGAFFAWLTDIPGTTRNRVGGMIIFGLVGALVIWLASLPSVAFWFSVAMFAVAFVFSLPMTISTRGYMIGWVTILLFIQIAPMTGSKDLPLIIADLFIGIGLVIVLTLLDPKGMGPWGSSGDNPPAESGGNNDYIFVLVYSLTFAMALGIAAFIGVNLLTVGAFWVANSAFFVMGPSTKQSLKPAIQRAIVVVLGMTVGHLVVAIIGGPTLLLWVIWVVFLFFTMATLNVSMPLAIGLYTALMMMDWVLLGFDVQELNFQSTERLIAEAIGIGLAFGAVIFLDWWGKHRSVETFTAQEIGS